jgi:hypothetical protein
MSLFLLPETSFPAVSRTQEFAGTPDRNGLGKGLHMPAILRVMNSSGFGDTMANGDSLSSDEKKRSAVLSELDQILESEAFHSSRRSRQFLSYVVRQTLEGKGDLLKERTIGADVFERSPADITAENSVVRKQAGEVRRRLEQYYKGAPEDTPVRIQLPVGSYVPEFCFSTVPAIPEAAVPRAAQESSISPSRMEVRAAHPARRIALWTALLSALLVTALCLGTWTFYRHYSRHQFFAQFWDPVSATSESLVVCLAKPVVYIPSREFYQRYSSTHGRDFGLEWQRLNERLPKDLDTPPRWTEMMVQKDFGVAKGDADAAFRIATLFGRLGKSSKLRIGDDCSLTDLRNAPVALIGAYNNRWTMEMTSNLHFTFSEEQGELSIREQAPSGRTWKIESNSSTRPSPWSAAPEQQPFTDYAIVSRLKNSQTGQYLIIVAGITGPGTQAAAEFVSSPQELDQALQRFAPGWENKNLQIVLRVPVPDNITPTAPQVIATYAW